MKPTDFDPKLLTLDQQFELTKIKRSLEEKSVEELKSYVIYLAFKLLHYHNTARGVFKENILKYPKIDEP